MVAQEFDAIWRQVQAELEREGASPEDEGKSEDELKAEYRAIAERRVRLGLVLAKIGEQNAITVQQDEVNRALAARARQFPGQEKQVIDYYTANPNAMAELRVPLFEDKVIDFLGELIEVKDRKVGRDILFLDPDDAAEKLKAEDEAANEPKTAKKGKAKAKDETEVKAKAADEAETPKPKAKEKSKAKKKKDE
jgi:trigger factor